MTTTDPNPSLPKIMVVDDDHKNIIAMKSILSDLDCDITTCTSGMEALEKLMEDEYALILLDVQMPGMDGFEAAELMRKNKHYKLIPIIFVTAINKEQRYVQQGHEVGAVDYLFKPIDPVNLISKVNIFLDYYCQHKKMRDLVDQLSDAQKSLETSNKELTTLARFDSVTGLANRLDFTEYLQAEIGKAERYERILAVLFLDLDNFKFVNDSYGHAAGDELLKQVASRLKASLRGSDILNRSNADSTLISRLGGDEFAVVLTDISSPENAAVVARRILGNLNPSFKLKQGVEITISASIGIACYPSAGGTPDELCKSADMAMYDVKKLGKASYRFYSEELNEMHRHYVLIEESLHAALRCDEFYLVYQPIVDLQTNETIGVEVLCRCSLNALSDVSPQEFILVAEECGLMQELGAWIFKTAIVEFEQHLMPLNRKLYIHINVSARQLQDLEFLNLVEFTYKNRPQLNPERITFELTETAIMQDTNLLVENLQSLTATGSHVSIDDFGTGYSSMAWLRHLPISSLKIDKEFVSDIMHNTNDAIITKSIIRLADNLELTTIAEGIETEQQRDFLCHHRCPLGQGYYFSKPLVIDDLVTYLKRQT